MKRVMIRPGKSVLVSDEAFGRAREALQALGIDDAAFKRLGEFKGDVTIGAKGVGAKVPKQGKGSLPVKKAAHFKIFKSRVAKAAQGFQAVQAADLPVATRDVVFGEPIRAERRRKLKVGA
jgi:hypothetical protein